jgi:hypothetical protein
VIVKLIQKVGNIEYQYTKDNGIITYTHVFHFYSIMSDGLKICSSVWCNLKQGLAYKLTFSCGYLNFVLPPLPTGILKIPDLFSCQGPVLSVL